MKTITTKKHKHLTLDERMEIQLCLDRGMTFKAIARRIEKDPTTVSKEVKKHLRKRTEDVERRDEQGKPIVREPCPDLLKAPFVCNGCALRRKRCPSPKQLYDAREAHKAYESLLVEAREGIPLSKEAFYKTDQLITQGVRKGQHLYHILQTQDLGVSKSTVYRHLHRGYLSVSPTEFPRVVKFKSRKPRKADYVPKALKLDRTYDDFRALVEEQQLLSWVEMDTVIGRIGGKVIVTFAFTFCNFMFGLLIKDKTAAAVADSITQLKRQLKQNALCFGDIFPVILTDNGGEFSNIFAIENNRDKQRETRLYFCDPYQSSQKPRVEKNHTLFRDIVPKGNSFDGFTQDTVNLIFSHVNSVKRRSLGGKTPYELFLFAFGETGEQIATCLGIEPIFAEDVIQSPKLLK